MYGRHCGYLIFSVSGCFCQPRQEQTYSEKSVVKPGIGRDDPSRDGSVGIKDLKPRGPTVKVERFREQRVADRRCCLEHVTRQELSQISWVVSAKRQPQQSSLSREINATHPSKTSLRQLESRARQRKGKRVVPGNPWRSTVGVDTEVRDVSRPQLLKFFNHGRPAEKVRASPPEP